MKKIYKKGTAKKKKKYDVGGPTSSDEPVSGYGPMKKFYKNVDRVLDDIFPGRQARQNLRKEAKAYRQGARLDRKKGRVDNRMRNFYQRKGMVPKGPLPPMEPLEKNLQPQEEQKFYTKEGGFVKAKTLRNAKGSRRSL